MPTQKSHEMMASYINRLLAITESSDEEGRLKDLSKDMVHLLRSPFVQNGLVEVFEALETNADITGIVATIQKFNCLDDLVRHLRCTLSTLPIVRGVVNMLMKNVCNNK